MYEPRLYRDAMNRDRFRFFQVTWMETDLMIGIPPDGFCREMETGLLQELKWIRHAIRSYASADPRFLTSLEPLEMPVGKHTGEPGSNTRLSPSNGDPGHDALTAGSPVPQEVITMLRCGKRTGTGPMSAVAGLFAERAGQWLASGYGTEEVVVENGGDLFLLNQSPLTAVIHAGGSPLSGRIGLEIPAGTWGVCTSSGTFGHSFSMGRADAVTVVAREAPLADAWATALANRVRGPEDIEAVLELAVSDPGILGCVVVAGDRLGVRGQFELKPVEWR